MITLFERRRTHPGRRWRQPLTGLIVVVAALALAPAALADGWTLQSAATESSWVNSELDGVSCPYPGTYSPTSPCFAGGFAEAAGGARRALIERWTGSAWSIDFVAGPAGSTGSSLSGISCPTTTFCMAVGTYSLSNQAFPLVYVTGPGGWTQQPAQLNPGQFGYFTSVSCRSSSFCVAVGASSLNGFPPSSAGAALAEVWNGQGFSQPPGGAGSQNALLNGVSCAPDQAFCMAVGSVSDASDTTHAPYAESYNGSGWIAQTVAGPANVPLAPLTGVYCIDADICNAYGNQYFSHLGVSIWGAAWNGSAWTLQSMPPSPADAAAGGGNGIACPSECWALGNYSNGTSLQLFADSLNGPQWEFATLPDPAGSEPQLNGVSCAEDNYCEAVGVYRAGSGELVAFAERYFYNPPSTGCKHFPCPPPKPGTPHHFALSAHGPEANGATVIAVLHKPRRLVLLVQGVRHHRVIIGLVPLGDYSVGTFRIPWNLRVNGRLLDKGTYEVSLHAISVDVLSPATPPGQITLTVRTNRHVTVGR